jgi:alpha-galactosidase
MEVWVKPLENEDWAVCFLNRSSKLMHVNFNWKDKLIADSLFNKTMNAKDHNYEIRNLWTKANSGDTQKPFSAALPSHDIIMLRLLK